MKWAHSLAFGAFVVTSHFALAQDAVVKRSLNIAYTKLSQAMMMKDVTGAMSISTPNMTYKMLDGKVLSRKEIEAMLTAQFAQVERIDLVTTKIVSLKVTGSKAVVVAKNRLTASITMKGKPAKVSTEGESRDTWIKKNGKWLIQTVVTLKERSLINGKPIG